MMAKNQVAQVFQSVEKSDINYIRDYLECGGNPNAVDKVTGNRLLCLAAQIGNVNVGELLLENGAEPNLASHAWPIHFAAGAGHSEFVELLLQYGSEVHCLDEDGGTPLSDAAAGGHANIVELLLEAGADPTYKDRDGRRAILYAAEKGHEDVVDMLAPYASEKEFELAQLRLKFSGSGLDLKEFVKYNLAANRGELNIIIEYIESGGDPNAYSLGGDTLLMTAARRGRIKIVKYLLANGADLNQLNENGCCALDCSLSAKTSEVYELLFPLTDEKYHKRAERDKQKNIDSKFSEW